MPTVPPSDVRQNEVDFCADVKSWSEALFAAHPEMPFGSASIEGPGPRSSRKRMDLRFFNREGKLALCGEVKLPGTPEGRSPYEDRLVNDANQKADAVGCRYFFTWNVNSLVLFDRQLYKLQVHERRLKDFPLGLNLERPQDVARAEVKARIRDVFLPDFFATFKDIYEERTRDWGMPPDAHFIRALETHLQWPVWHTRDWLAVTADDDAAFSAKLERWMATDQQWTFTRQDDQEWRAALERAARTLCYVFANRLIFYEAVRSHYDTLPKLKIPAGKRTPEQIYEHFQKAFQNAVEQTGDYEPIFYPTERDRDWAGPLVFAAPGVLDAWGAVLESLGKFMLKELPHDVMGKIFQRLISPEERQMFGQFYTHEDIVDVMNAFCIRKADAKVLDPACGSGSFLVRAYARKAWLDPSKGHQELLMELFGCDIALFAAHLATLNLASRKIHWEANYPQIARRNFFEVEAGEPFCNIPGPRIRGSERSIHAVMMPELDAVVGNPPYVRQELIPRRSDRHAPRKQTKEYLQKLVSLRWPGVKLSGRSDLHCYFWLAATAFLKEKGAFGFLTSSSWMDVEYGFALQDWVLRNFRVLAVLESTDEPWFVDARVKTCATILQRCNDPEARDSTLVKFVQIKRPLAQILQLKGGEQEDTRQRAADQFRSLVEKAKTDFADDNVRIIVKPQKELWDQGVSAKPLISRSNESETGEHDARGSPYGGGKWGRYLRAPDFYFDIMHEFGERFVPLGKLAEIRFGLKSGCDAFFMPRDVTDWALKEEQTPPGFKRRFGCPREEAEAGRVRIVRAGDESVHPIEREYLMPEVQSLMSVTRPTICEEDVDRVVLMVTRSKDELIDTYVLKYIRYGEHHTFASSRSEGVPVPNRSTCAGRPVWYDLSGRRIGFAFWPKSQQYRHIAPINPDGLICNCNLYDLNAPELSEADWSVLVHVLNSTVVALFKTFYGRYAGTEGNLKTEVVDVNLLEIPDPRKARAAIRARLKLAFEAMCTRPSGRLVETRLMECHSPERAREIAKGSVELPEELRQPDRRALDEAVFEMLGVSDAKRRTALVDKLYEATALHFRRIRVMEIEKQVQRAKATATQFSPEELANDIWDSLAPEDKKPIAEWLIGQPGAKEIIIILPGPAAIGGANSFTDANTVYFGKQRGDHATFPNRPLARLVETLSNLGLTGPHELPVLGAAARELQVKLDALLAARLEHIQTLAASRTGTDRLLEGITSLLQLWSTRGKSS